MIYGMGIDCAAIARVARSMRRAGFCEKVFSEAEQAALDKLPPRRRAESGAACFAAKEAFLKAAGVGLGGFPLREIAALRRESGQPYYACSGAAAQFCEENSLRAHLSLTHESGLAIACAVLETHT